jgi:streptogramin lyase
MAFRPPLQVRSNWPRTLLKAILVCCLTCALSLVCVVPLLARPLVTAHEGRDTTSADSTTNAEVSGKLEGRADFPPRHFQNIQTEDGNARMTDLKFTHLTTNDGLSQGYVSAILQDRRGFMWFATGEGLNRYDGNSFVVFKNNPDDPGTLSHNFVRDMVEDDEGYLWVVAYPGINKFDPRTERCKRYLPDPKSPNSIGSEAVWRITRDSRGYLWLAEDSGVDRFEPKAETFTHYRNDNSGYFVGRVNDVIEDSHGEIWFAGELGLFHLNPQTGQINSPSRDQQGFWRKVFVRR